MKRYPEAVAEYEACIAVLAKEPEVPPTSRGNSGVRIAEDLLHQRLLRANAILSNGQPDEATTAGIDAIRTYWEVCGRLQSRPGNFTTTINYDAAIEILRQASMVVVDLRNAKATAQLDRWAAEVRPTLEQAAAELFKRQGPKGAASQTASLCEHFRLRMWELADAGKPKEAVAYADHILALKPEALFAARISMVRVRHLALTDDHAGAAQAVRALLAAPNAPLNDVWFVGDAALCYAACANACQGDDVVRERYAGEAVRLLRVCWGIDPRRLPRLSNLPEFRPHEGRADFQSLKKEIDAEFPPPKELAPPPREVK